MRYNGFGNGNFSIFNANKILFLHWIDIIKLKLYKVVLYVKILENRFYMSYFQSNCRYVEWIARYNGFSNDKFSE